MKHLLITTIAAVFLATTSFAGPIHDAARNGDLEVVQTQLNKGVDVDAKNTAMGDTPLHHAAANGHEEIVKLLIAKGADVNENVNWEGARLHGLATYEDTDGIEYEYDEFTKRLTPLDETYDRDRELSSEIYGSAPDAPERAFEWLSNVEDQLELVEEGANIFGTVVNVYERADGGLFAYRAETQDGPGGDQDHSLRMLVVLVDFPNSANAITDPDLGSYTALSPVKDDADYITIEGGGIYNDPGAIAIDIFEGDNVGGGSMDLVNKSLRR